MQNEFGTGPENLIATFGPAIRLCCYEVGEELRSFFPKGVAERSGKYYLDLAGVNKAQLLQEGVDSGNISDSGICTCCSNDRFYSFRKEGKGCGRIVSIAMLR
jgi:copper oxidase (laccase) domain-containing protein